MENSIQLICDSIRKGSLTLHPDKAKTLGIINHQKGLIKFGIQSFPIEVYISYDLQVNQARLSSDMIKKLEIPVNCHFDIQQKDNEIQIGPYIGILAGFYQKSVKKHLDDLLDYLYHYRDIRGAILVFSLDNVDKVNHTMKGYLFNAVTNQWDEGTFPYPSSIFIKTGTVSSKWLKHFQSVMGDSLFNDFYFNKWSIHKRLAASPHVKAYLPPSILYEKPSDIYSFLKQYPNAIIKSINASKGSSIYKISTDGHNLVIACPKTGDINKIKFKNRDEAYSLFKKYFEEREFMIQEALDLITYQNRTIDFRVITLKNQQGQWQVMGVFARHGQPGNILSNISPLVKSGEKTLKEVLQLSNSKVKAFMQEISLVAIEAAKAIENSDVHFANTGVDIAIDDKEKLWIIEIQHCNPSHDIALEAGFAELYYEILKTNMLYAKKLAGFPNNFSNSL
ncbi:YheC/YheD family protein [Bacillus songklensis]|uniref:YheC/YheD family protein n=1 Tax=Bacillus songklensis TaxID=1069116 RepID=A0ABV8B8L0_9BACI